MDPPAPATSIPTESGAASRVGASVTARKLAPPRKIVAAVDMSVDSLHALDLAMSVAQDAAASVYVVHVVEPAALLVGLEYLPIGTPSSAVVDYQERLLAQITAPRDGSGKLAHSTVRIGRPAEEVVAIASQLEADLIVVASHGISGSKYTPLGSTAERIVRIATVPVLVARELDSLSRSEAELFHPKLIVVPTDFSPRSEDALRYAGILAAGYASTLRLIHCIHLDHHDAAGPESGIDLGEVEASVKKSAEHQLQRLVHECVPGTVKAHAHVCVGNPVIEVPDFAARTNADLIVCANHAREEPTFNDLGRTAERLVRYTPCSILVLPYLNPLQGQE